LITKQDPEQTVSRLIAEISELYATFIKDADRGAPALLGDFMSLSKSRERFNRASEFGDRIYDLLHAIGTNNRFGRLLTV